MLVTFKGIVKDGVVRLAPGAKLRNGTEVIVAVWRRPRKLEKWSVPPEIEAEDAEFVRICRPSINKAMRADEAWFKRRRGKLGERKGRKGGAGTPSRTRIAPKEAP